MAARARDREKPELVAQSILGEDGHRWMHLAHVDLGTWAAARQRFRALSRAGLSFTDCTSVATIESLGLEGVVSFDPGFDAIVTRFS